MAFIDAGKEELEHLRQLGEWLVTPAGALGGERPLNLMDTELGLILALQALLNEAWVEE